MRSLPRYPDPESHVENCRCRPDSEGRWQMADMRCLTAPQRRIIFALIDAEGAAKASAQTWPE